MDEFLEDNVVYYRPEESLLKRFLSGIARGALLLVEPVRRNARWKKHNVYRLRPSAKSRTITRAASGRSWRRHRIPEMPRTRYYSM